MSTRLVGMRDGDGSVHVGQLATDGAHVTRIAPLEDFWAAPSHFFASLPGTGPTLPSARVDFVPPVLPGARVFCIGLNYLTHVAEGSYASDGVPEHPTLFARWPASLTVGGTAIEVPANEAGLDWEGEVVAYVGATLSDADSQQALDSIVAYSTFNDVTARRAQKLTSQWTLGKNADRSGPLGPMVPADEVGDLRDGLRIQTRVNDEVVQDARTDQMVYTVGDTLALISRTLTVHAGDLLATGTPSGVGYSRVPPMLMQPGDAVEVEVERLGVLRSTIAARSRRAG